VKCGVVPIAAIERLQPSPGVGDVPQALAGAITQAAIWPFP